VRYGIGWTEPSALQPTVQSATSLV
jgi:hypothetical protein